MIKILDLLKAKKGTVTEFQFCYEEINRDVANKVTGQHKLFVQFEKTGVQKLV